MVPVCDPTVPPSNNPTNQSYAVSNELESASMTQEMMANAYPTSSPTELAMYLHQVLCSPPKTTLLKAIRNNQLSSIPGLTYELIANHLPPSTATEKGHMIRTRQGLRSTRTNKQGILDARQIVDDMQPLQQSCTAIDNEMFCFAALADQNENTIYSDLCGRFPVRSFSGMNYIFVAYIYTINAIIIRPMKSRNDECMVATFKDIYEYLQSKKLAPKLHVLDNECFKAVQRYIKGQQVNIQLVEPHNHRVNAAETAVKAVKYHMLAALATIDPTCPLQLWDKFLPQIQDTLNLLRTSRRDSSVSAYQEMEGDFDFNKTPMAILGLRALAYVDPTIRAAWEPHALDAIYVSSCKQHYRLLEFWIDKTKNYRTSGTYRTYPAHCSTPTLSEADKTIIAATELVRELNSKSPINAHIKSKHAKSIQQLTNILSNAPSPRVGDAASPRVGDTTAPRVGSQQSSSADPTSKRTIQSTKFVHGRRTRNNNPLPSINEELEPPLQNASNHDARPKETNLPTVDK